MLGASEGLRWEVEGPHTDAPKLHARFIWRQREGQQRHLGKEP